MAITPIIAEPDDGALISLVNAGDNGAVWPAGVMLEARRGQDLHTDAEYDPTVGALLAVGGHSISNYQMRIYQAWMHFPDDKGFILPATSDLVTASMRLSLGRFDYGTSANGDSLQGWNFPQTFPLAGGGWKNIENFGTSQTYDFEYYKVENEATSGSLFESGGEQLITNILAKLAVPGTDYNLLFETYTALFNFANNLSRRMWINASNKPTITDAFRPTLILRSQQKHALNAVGSSAIQLTDGTAVFLRYDRTEPSVRLFYQRPHQTVATQIAKIPTNTTDNATDYFQIGKGFQTFSITRDESNNIYVVGMRGALQGNHVSGIKYFNVQSFKYTGNYAWTIYVPTQCGENALPSFETSRALPNNFSACWLPGSTFGASGQLAIMYSHRDAQWARNQFGVYVAYAGWFNGAGTPGKNTKANFADVLASSAAWRPANSVGTGLDAIPDGDRLRFGTFIQAVNTSDQERSAAGLVLTPNTHVPGKPTYVTNSISTNSPHEPDAKIRMPWLGDSVAYYCVARHGHIQVNRKSDDALFQQIDLTQMGLTGFPSREILQRMQAWDIVMDSVDTDWLWIYYRDSQNSRLLRKVRWNYLTNVLDTSFQFTPSPLGPSGSRIQAIRVPRQKVQTNSILVDVAMVDGGNNPVNLITLRDTSMNKAPTAPTLAGFPYFNAIQNTDVVYTFNDPSPQDYATTHDIQVRRVDTSTVVYSPSGVTATLVDLPTRKYKHVVAANALSNDTSYQIRVRTYDSVGTVSPWSEYTAFTTSGTGGGVVITDPAADYPPLDRSSVMVRWTYSNTNPAIIQNGYRIRVFNNNTNALFSDTAVVNSTATERLITGLWSDIPFRIEVSILDSAGSLSGAGVRLVLAKYNDPAVPTIALDTQKGFLRIRVTNPPPSGENPVTVSNQIARKRAGESDGTYVIIGTCPPNSTFDDHTVASRGQYTYKARGVA